MLCLAWIIKWQLWQWQAVQQKSLIAKMNFCIGICDSSRPPIKLTPPVDAWSNLHISMVFLQDLSNALNSDKLTSAIGKFRRLRECQKN
jgi:hypothetical protein